MNKKRRFSGIYNNILYATLLSALVIGIFLYIITVITQFSSVDVENFKRVILVGILVLLVFQLLYFIGFSQRKRFFRQAFFVVGLVLFLAGSYTCFYMYRALSSINQVIDESTFETVEYSVIGFSENDTVEKLDDGVIGFIEHSEEFDQLMQNAIRPHSRVVKYLEFPDYQSMLTASRKGLIQYALVPKEYSRLDEQYDVPEGEDRPLANAQTLFGFTTKISDESEKVEVLDQPFSILLLGNNEGLSDSIIVATVNPKTLNVTMTSLARDSYLPIACYPNQSRDKLNHARARGRQCIEDTIENYLDLKIDFYFETDFYALQKIVDALGGIELESPVSFGGSLPKENNPKEYHEIWINKGLQKMDGKAAITFARERYHMPRGDFDRQLNQQYVIKEVANAIIRERNPERLVSVLEGASQNIKTNLPINTITKLLGYAVQQIDASPLDASNTFRIESSQILGTTPSIGGMSIIVPYKNDVKYTQDFIKANLVTKPSLKNIRTFGFDINKPYQTLNQKRSPWGDASGGTIDIGKPIVDNTKPTVDKTIMVPDFTLASKYSRADLESWAKNNGIKLNITILEIDSSVDNKFKHNQVTNQEYAGQSVSVKLLQSKPLNVTFVKDVFVPVAKIEFPGYTNLAELKSWAQTAGIKLNINETTPAPVKEKVGKSVDGSPVLPKGSYTRDELSKHVFSFYGALKEQEVPPKPPVTEPKPPVTGEPGSGGDAENGNE